VRAGWVHDGGAAVGGLPLPQFTRRQPEITNQPTHQTCLCPPPPRFLLGNLSDFDSAAHAVPYDQLPAVDRWLLSSHARLMAEVQEGYETYQVSVWACVCVCLRVCGGASRRQSAPAAASRRSSTHPH
jgi:hypothetical protein